MIVFSSLMFVYYFVFLKDKTFHHYNRFYLLSIIFISILLPLIKVEYFTIEVNPDVYLLLENMQIIKSDAESNFQFSPYFLVGSLLFLGSIFYLIKLSIGLYKIHRLQFNYEKETFQGINFYQTKLEDAPFSFLKNLFWKDSIAINSTYGKQILKHEMVHIEQNHTLDKLLISTVTAIFWFNPIFHLLKREISLLHEYLADKKTVQKNDVKAFAQMLLSSHFAETNLPATSQFLNSNLKKRLIMLKKSHTKFSYARKILALPLVFILGFAFLVNAKNREISKTNVEIAKAVFQIKNDTIKNPYKRNNIDTFSFKNKIAESSETEVFTIDNKVVSKQEYKDFYLKNIGNENFKYFLNEITDLNPKRVFGASLVEKSGYEISENKIKFNEKTTDNGREGLVASSHSQGINSYYSKNVNNSTEKDQFYFNYKKISRKDFLKLVNEDLGKSTNYFGYIESVNNNKIFSAKSDMNLQLPDEFINALDKKYSFQTQKYTSTATNSIANSQSKNNSKTGNAKNAKESDIFIIDEVKKTKIEYLNMLAEIENKDQLKFIFKTDKTENDVKIYGVWTKGFAKIKNYSATSTFVEDDYDKQYDADAAKVIEIQENLKKKLGKKVVLENVAIERKFPDGSNYKIEVKGDKVTMDPTLSNKYDKIYINGKLSTQADLDKIDKNKITSQKIKKNNDNGEINNEIKIRTKK